MDEAKPLKKKPSQTRSKQTVEAILEAATYILQQSGAARFNTNAISAKAGVSVASLYQFFSNKEAISSELINRLLDENLNQMESFFHDTDITDIREQVKHSIQLIFENFEKQGALATFVMENVIRVVGFSRFNYIEQRLVIFVMELLKKKGIHFPHPNPELRIKVAIQCVRALIMTYFLNPERYDRE